MKLKFPFRLEALKKIDKNYLLIAALVGVLLFVIVIPIEEPGKTPSGDSETLSKTDNSNAGLSETDTYVDKEVYKAALERQLKDILESMEGVGRVEVMLTLKDMGEAVVEKDVTSSEQNTTEEDAEGTQRESQVRDTQETTVYHQTDSTSNVPFVKQEVNPKVEGVVVVAEGGQNSVVVKNISDAVLALFSIAPHKIKVVKLN